MITVSDRSRAAVSALAELARRAEPAPVPILEIAEGCHIPLHVFGRPAPRMGDERELGKQEAKLAEKGQ